MSIIVVLHLTLYLLFVLRALGIRRAAAEVASTEPRQARTAPGSRALVVFHGVGFTLMYVGLARALRSGIDPTIAGTLAGLALHVLAIGLAGWALWVFGSWRLRAHLEADHALTTDGPFGLVRHPIYLSVNLVALGTFLWYPGTMAGLAVVLMCLGSDLRARAEERVLVEVFPEYDAYRKRVARMVPFLY